MKKLIFSFFLFSLIAVSGQAQKASCCKAGGKSAAACEAKAASASSTESSAAAEKVASMDQTIEKRADPITGNVSYVRKETSSQDGTVSFVNVSFDPVSNTFVNVAPMEMENGHCKGEKGKSMSGKSCCAAGAAAGKSCCSGKAASSKCGEKSKS